MSRLHGTKDFWLGALRADGPAFRSAVAGAGPDAPVPSCPEWTTTDLVQHLAGIYHWVRGVVTAGNAEPPTARQTSDDGLPSGPAALDWWQHEYDQLLATLDGLDPETPAWNWAPQPKRVGFWPRRMALETTVHRWDAQLAIATAEPIEAKLAADGVSEVLDTWLPAGRRRSPEPRYGVVQLVATDAGQDWFLRLRGSGVALLDTDTILDSDDHHARAHVTGNASDLLLAVWGRVNFEVLEVSGDVTLLEGLRAG